jgi:transcriptional regulator with XRE-family HTH domain
MTSQSDDLYVLKGRDLENYGFARIRDIAYDAVQELWQRRKSEGWNQIKLANNIGRDTGWLSRYLRGPGNWTFRTFGALVQGLEGEVEIVVRPRENLLAARHNHSPYSRYILDVTEVRRPTPTANAKGVMSFDRTPRTGAANSPLVSLAG